MPNNCNECEHTKTCQSHFGGLGCEYQKEIARKERQHEEEG